VFGMGTGVTLLL